MTNGAATTAPTILVIRAGFNPKKPKAINPRTMPIPATDRMSKKMPVNPSMENHANRTGMKTASAMITDVVKALLVTLPQ